MNEETYPLKMKYISEAGFVDEDKNLDTMNHICTLALQ